MKDAYPELIESANRVAEMIKGEETRFAHTLDIGLGRLEELLNEVGQRPPVPEKPLEEILDDVRKPRVIPTDEDISRMRVLSGKDAFKLYDTFGLPLDFMTMRP